MESLNFIDLIKKGHDEWNAFKKSQNCSLDLSGLNLSHKDLRNFDFSGCILENANFQKSHLGNAIFFKTKASGASFKKAYFKNVNFSWSDLRSADLRGCIIKDSTFDSCRLSRSDLSGVKIKKASFKNTGIRDSNFNDCKIDSADFGKAKFSNNNFLNSELANTNFSFSVLINSTFQNGLISDCCFENSILYKSSIEGVSIANCNFTKSLFRGGKILDSKIIKSIFIKADFRNTQLTSTSFKDSDISYSKIFGVSAWNLSLENTIQENLRLSDKNEPSITIDNIEVAQFIYLLIRNEKLRNVITTITSKVVLILGRFTNDRIKILTLIRDELKSKNYLPILFDFENSPNRDLTETVATIALLSKFIIADITEPKSIPQELSHIVPNMPSLPVQPIIMNGHSEYGMFEHFQRYPWVLNIVEYIDEDDIKYNILDKIISSCENKINELHKQNFS